MYKNNNADVNQNIEFNTKAKSIKGNASFHCKLILYNNNYYIF